MLISIPLSQKGEDPLISDKFAMSKWFALVDDDTIEFKKNEKEDGVAVVNWLNQLGVTHIITNKIGIKTFNKLKDLDITCLGIDLNTKFTDVIQKVKSNKLTVLNEDTSVIKKSCTH